MSFAALPRVRVVESLLRVSPLGVRLTDLARGQPVFGCRDETAS